MFVELRAVKFSAYQDGSDGKGYQTTFKKALAERHIPSNIYSSYCRSSLHIRGQQSDLSAPPITGRSFGLSI